MTIVLNNLTLTYERHPAVHHLNATISSGAWLAIVGPNGAGKSTLLNALAGHIKTDKGVIEGLDSNDIAYMPQQSRLDDQFPITVLELIATGLWSKIGYSKALSNDQYDACNAALSSVGLNGFEHRLIHTLSGGQRQRCLFARILVQDKPVILLDEPFNAIDSKTLVDLTALIKTWNRDQRTIIMVTHDIEYVREHCPYTLLLARECIDHGSTQNVLTNENLKKAKNLSEAFDDTAELCMQGVV